MSPKPGPGPDNRATIANMPTTISFLTSRDGYKCCFCDTNKSLTIDHIIPISMGGGNRKENLRFLCYNCNQCRRNKFIPKRDKQREGA